MHGFALNVRDLRHAFAAIVPCGLVGTGVTSLEQLTGRAPALGDVEERTIDAVKRELAYDVVTSAGDTDMRYASPAGAPVTAGARA